MFHNAAMRDDAGKRVDLDQESRARIYRWLVYFWRLYEDDLRTYKAYAARLGLSVPTVHGYLAGNRKHAGLEILLKLRTAFHVTSDRILDFEPPELRAGERPPPLDVAPHPAETVDSPKRRRSH